MQFIIVGMVHFVVSVHFIQEYIDCRSKDVCNRPSMFKLVHRFFSATNKRMLCSLGKYLINSLKLNLLEIIVNLSIYYDDLYKVFILYTYCSFVKNNICIFSYDKVDCY